MADSKRTLILGDVHGCRIELEKLLERCGFTEDDELVFVGDLVAKGPDSHGVVRLARERGARSVRGNHDERCLTYFRAKQHGRPVPELKPEHRAVCNALDDDDFRWLEAQPFWLKLDDVLVVHAGLRPGIPLEQQDHHELTCMRSLRPDGTPSTRVDEGVPWASQWPGPEEVVFGHDAIRGLQRYPKATGLDTGCVYGGQLTAYILPERRLVAVDAERVWCRKSS